MELKDILTLALSSLAGAVGLAALVKAIAEYRRSIATKRFELFLEMRKRLRDDKDFNDICDMLQAKDEGLRNVSSTKKGRFIGFFEELAIMRNSGLINDDVAFYMFGDSAIACRDEENFWKCMKPERPELYKLFFSFADDMKRTYNEFKFDKRKFHIA